MNNFEKQKLQDILILTSILIHKKQKEEKREKRRLKKSLVLKGHLITMKKVPLLRGGTFQIQNVQQLCFTHNKARGEGILRIKGPCKVELQLTRKHMQYHQVSKEMGGCLCLLLKSGSDFTPIYKHIDPLTQGVYIIFYLGFRGIFMHVLNTIQHKVFVYVQ